MDDCKSTPPSKQQRRISKKKSYISIDDVTVSAGRDYMNWITICKQKLIQRENAFMDIRTNMTERIVNKALAQFYQRIHYQPKASTFKVSELILAETKHEMIGAMNHWNGIDVKKLKVYKPVPYKSFRKYFVVAKNWWDQRKTSILGSVFWSKILYQLQSDINAKFTQNKNVPMAALSHVLVALLQAQVKYLNTKNQPLIANGLIKNCEQIKSFLLQLHPSLNVDSFMVSGSNDRHQTSAQYLANKLRESMIYLMNFYHNELVKNQNQNQRQHNVQKQIGSDSRQLNAMIFALAQRFMSNNNQFVNVQVAPPQLPPPHYQHAAHCRYGHGRPVRPLHSSPHSQPPTAIIFRPVIVPVPMPVSTMSVPNGYNGYRAVHCMNSDYRVVNQRFNPMISRFNPRQSSPQK